MTSPDEQDGTKKGRAIYDRIARKLREGRRHPTLGFHPDRGDADWWQAGEGRFRKVVHVFKILPKHRVIDYGCGTLRLGGHFIRFLDRGNYFGLDVSADLIGIGRELVGADIIADKAPHLAAIDGHSLAEAQEFGAAFVFSEAVAYHVLPNELDFYYTALKRLASVPGSVLLISVRLADIDSEYIQGCWARPLDAYVQALAPLKYVGLHFMQTGPAGDKHAGIGSATLEFRRELTVSG